ncbi:GreA/GreB family elongation factor [Wenyingzhuangia sp. IMCC45574]
MEKLVLLEACVALVDEKLTKIQTAMDGYKKDLLSESKSSVGDKHETGRAMLQLEMEKLGQQYQTVLVQKQALQKIDISKKKSVTVGSLILASGVHYFLATSIGRVALDKEMAMVISANSPIGQALVNKEVGDVVVFNGKKIIISEIL